MQAAEIKPLPPHSIFELLQLARILVRDQVLYLISPAVAANPNRRSLVSTCLREVRRSVQLLIHEDFTDHKIAHSRFSRDVRTSRILLKRLVGERGFEPPTPWSRTRCSIKDKRKVRQTQKNTRQSDLILGARNLSMNFVSKFPAWKSGSDRMRRCRGIVV